MKLQTIKELLSLDVTDDDILPFFKSIYEVFGKDNLILFNEMRSVLIENRDFGDGVDLIDELLRKGQDLRETFFFEVTQVPESGHRSMALLKFARFKLSIKFDQLKYLVLKAQEEGFKEATGILNSSFIFSDKVSDSQRTIAARNLIHEIGPKEGGLFLAYAFDKNKDKSLISFDELLECADNGSTSCALQVAQHYERNKEYERAAKYFEIGRFNVNPHASYEYARTYLDKKFKRVDLEKATRLLIHAAMIGSNEASFFLAKNCIETKSDFHLAEGYLKMSSRNGHPDAEFYLADLYFGKFEGTPADLIDKEKAVWMYERLAKKGNGDACGRIGDFYYYGLDSMYRKDKKLAIAYYEYGCRRGSSYCAIAYARMIYKEEIEFDKSYTPMMIAFLAAMSSEDYDFALQAKEEFVSVLKNGYALPKPYPQLAGRVESMELEPGLPFPDAYRKNQQKFRLILKEIEQTKKNEKRD